MAGTASGSIKGWITRKLKKKDPNLTFEIVAGISDEEDLASVGDFLTEQLGEEYGIDEEFMKDKRIYYENGEWKVDQAVQETLQIEKYGVPKGENTKVWVKIESIKNWVRSKGLHKDIEPDTWLGRRIKGRGYSSDFISYGAGGEEQGKPHQGERWIHDIAYAIQKDWHDNGFKTEWIKDPNKDNVWKNKYTGKLIDEKLIKKKRLE
ncbi:MAG: hypothetical protein H8D92_02580 [Pelagibacteraceae bacterium]|nr:hypothetical protein [Pelagibacteraceae bacterium]